MDRDLQELKDLSAALGGDTSLVQGPGGNTSIKDGSGRLWIKASGTWLRRAEDEPIFVPLRHAAVLQAIEAGQEALPSQAILPGGPEGLRPSVETSLHALLLHRVVAHSHAVNAIAAAVRADAEARLAERLAGLDWAFVSYCRPGLPLTLSVAAAVRQRRPDVLLLGNHGLVVGAESGEAALALTYEVERRLERPARPAATRPSGDLPVRIEGNWRLPAEGVSHAVAFDDEALSIARGGSLYPDHVVFLGHAIAVSDAPEAVADAPACVVPGEGVLLRGDLPPAADWMIHALSEVTTRLGRDDRLRYLTLEEEAELLNWDAEKYRQALSRKTA